MFVETTLTGTAATFEQAVEAGISAALEKAPDDESCTLEARLAAECPKPCLVRWEKRAAQRWIREFFPVKFRDGRE